MNTINFMYFAYNFDYKHLESIFEALGNKSHFEDKFRNARGNTGTEAFFTWFMQLSINNMQVVTDWIDTNYISFE